MSFHPPGTYGQHFQNHHRSPYCEVHDPLVPLGKQLLHEVGDSGGVGKQMLAQGHSCHSNSISKHNSLWLSGKSCVVQLVCDC